MAKSYDEMYQVRTGAAGPGRPGALTDEQVFDMRCEYLAGATKRSLGVKYGISPTMVASVVRPKDHKRASYKSAPYPTQAQVRRFQKSLEAA